MTPRQLLAAARKAGVDVRINPDTDKVTVTFGPETTQPLPAKLILDCVDRAGELRPLLESVILDGAA